MTFPAEAWVRCWTRRPAALKVNGKPPRLIARGPSRHATAPDKFMADVLPHILAVDDDPDIRQVITEYLENNDLRVSAVETGSAMKELLKSEVVDLIVLDLRLKGEDGMTLARQLREESSIPIIILTGKADEADRVMSLELAADDYLTKPFSPRELLARIRSLLRRAKASATLAEEVGKRRAYRFEGWELNVPLRKIKSPDGRTLSLSNGEFSLLTALLSAPERVLTRAQLLELSRLYGDEVYDRSIDVQILRLRRKIEADPSQPKFILTERGAGYVFAVPVEVI
jgi:DNA-binding response OmpR family regulator